ncbi:hypothetical protein TNCV_615251 [Trichonephila clavipes]|nr:hypothetical protein TNCV_615251 [Trichonephila clavipes]
MHPTTKPDAGVPPHRLWSSPDSAYSITMDISLFGDKKKKASELLAFHHRQLYVNKLYFKLFNYYFVSLNVNSALQNVIRSRLSTTVSFTLHERLINEYIAVVDGMANSITGNSATATTITAFQENHLNPRPQTQMH